MVFSMTNFYFTSFSIVFAGISICSILVPSNFSVIAGLSIYQIFGQSHVWEFECFNKYLYCLAYVYIMIVQIC